MGRVLPALGREVAATAEGAVGRDVGMDAGIEGRAAEGGATVGMVGLDAGTRGAAAEGAAGVAGLDVGMVGCVGALTAGAVGRAMEEGTVGPTTGPPGAGAGARMPGAAVGRVGPEVGSEGRAGFAAEAWDCVGGGDSIMRGCCAMAWLWLCCCAAVSAGRGVSHMSHLACCGSLRKEHSGQLHPHCCLYASRCLL